jgi:hypothetical protein
MLISHQPWANHQDIGIALRHDHLSRNLTEMKPLTRLHRQPVPFAIGSLKSKIANVVVPVVQRIEQGFPKP